MSLSVKHLNADTTFLLTFAPLIAPDHSRVNFPGSFTILVDPWLAGPSSVWTPSFQISHHIKEPCVSSLEDLPEADLILISQDKPDHCHKETLCTLPPDSRVSILATPAAAKLIKSWRYFTRANIQTIDPFSTRKEGTVYRIELDSYTPNGTPGEVTISYIPEKRDMTGLHNAIGFTYRAPGSTFVNRFGTQVQLPLSPPASCRTRSRSISRPQSADSNAPIDSMFDWQMSKSELPISPARSRPLSAKMDQPISVLYTPHGMSYATLSPYIRYLEKLGALPLTALFHSINVEQNPWFLGGLVARGFPGGMEIIRKIGAKYWISAHDEAKDNQGWSTAMIKSTAYSIDDVQEILDNECGREISSSNNDGYGFSLQRKTTVIDLDVGEELLA